LEYLLNEEMSIPVQFQGIHLKRDSLWPQPVSAMA